VWVPRFQVYNEMLSADLASLGPDFETPIYFFQGELDERAQVSLAKEYFDNINAPQRNSCVLRVLDILLSGACLADFCLSWSLASVRLRWDHSHGVETVGPDPTKLGFL